MKRTNFINKKISEQFGITLIALVITIIVLLILATVSISLVINNGILDKAKHAVDKYSEGEICEQIKLAYLECETEKLYNSNVNEKDYMENSLKQKLNNEDLTVKVKNEKVTVNITIKGETKTYIYKSSTGESFEYKDPFDYGGKEKKDLIPGNDISIGDENFRVFYNENNVIKAMPFYNLQLNNNLIKQAIQSTGDKSIFSKSKYWNTGDTSIPMDNSENSIQAYIEGYKQTLEKMGCIDIEVKNSTISEIKTDDITAEIRNPGQIGMFWISTSIKNDDKGLYYVYDDGRIFGANYDNGNNGVRPIIIIEY